MWFSVPASSDVQDQDRAPGARAAGGELVVACPFRVGLVAVPMVRLAVDDACQAGPAHALAAGGRNVDAMARQRGHDSLVLGDAICLARARAAHGELGTVARRLH